MRFRMQRAVYPGCKAVEMLFCFLCLALVFEQASSVLSRCGQPFVDKIVHNGRVLGHHRHDNTSRRFSKAKMPTKSLEYVTPFMNVPFVLCPAGDNILEAKILVVRMKLFWRSSRANSYRRTLGQRYCLCLDISPKVLVCQVLSGLLG